MSGDGAEQIGGFDVLPLRNANYELWRNIHTDWLLEALLNRIL